MTPKNVRVIILTLFLVVLGATQAFAQGAIYDSTSNPLPGNVVSFGYEATGSSAIGDRVRFSAGSGRHLTTVVQTMSSWGCQSGHWNTGDCVTTPGATFSHPITLNIYHVGAGNQPGALIRSVTQTFQIPYRPSADTVNCTGGRWFDATSGTCFNGFATNITFNLASLNLVLPDEVIYGIAYNTTNFGSAPIGASACSASAAGCGYDSLNLGVAETAPTVGTDPAPADAYYNGAFASNYCDGGTAGTGTFRLDAGCWTGFKPAIQFNADFLSCGTTVVTESDIVRQPENSLPTDNWVFYFRTPASLGTFRNGPATPPAGAGSFETVTPTGGDKGTLFNFDHISTQLAAINRMGYSTYRTSGGVVNQVPAINIQIDRNGGSYNPATDFATDFSTLVFEPVYNTNQGAVVDGAWQTWDAYAGGNAVWWSSRDLRDASNNLVLCNPNGANANTPACAGKVFVPWSYIISVIPNATILGGYGINQGSGNPALTASSDALAIGYGSFCITYDFERDSDGDGVPDGSDACPNTPPGTQVNASGCPLAVNKDQCKNGGWQTLRRANNTTFKNQGDCVSYTNNGK
jgi:hypothetical protein